MAQVPLSSVSRSTRPTPQSPEGGQIAPVEDARPRQTQQLGAAMSQAGADLTSLAARMNEDHALATAKSALNSWSEFADNATRDYQSQLGRDAIDVDGEPGGASKRAGDGIENRMLVIEKGLGSDNARRMFRDRAERGLVAYRGRLATHELKQTNAFNHGENVAALGSWSGKYAEGYEGAFGNALSYASEIAADRGMGKEQRAAFMLDVKTKMHSGRVSNLLATETTAAADGYLRGVKRGEIDVPTRQALRAKLDRVMDAEASSVAGIELVMNEGFATQAETPTDAAKQKAVEAEVTKATGLAARVEALSLPSVINQIPDNALTLDLEIARERHPNQPKAGNGVIWNRAMQSLDEQFRAGKITGEQYRDRQRVVTEQVKLRIAAQNAAAEETMLGIEQALSTMPIGTTVDSPSFKAAHPELYESAAGLAVLSQARGITDRRTRQMHLQMFWGGLTDGSIAKMSSSQFYATFYGNLDESDYKYGFNKWQSMQKDAELPTDFVENEIQNHLAIAGEFTGLPDADGIPTANKDKPEEMDLWRRTMLSLNRRRVNGEKFKSPEEMRKWVSDVVLGPKGRVGGDRGWFGGVNIEERSAFELKHELDEARMGGDQKAIDRAKARRQSVVTPVELEGGGNVWVRTIGNRLDSIAEDPDKPDVTTVIPANEVDQVVDGERTDQLAQMVETGQLRPEEYEDTILAFRQMGMFDPDDVVTAKERAAIEARFIQLGVPMPSIAQQVVMIEDRRRWDADAPRRAEEARRHKARFEQSIGVRRALDELRRVPDFGPGTPGFDRSFGPGAPVQEGTVLERANKQEIDEINRKRDLERIDRIVEGYPVDEQAEIRRRLEAQLKAKRK